MSDKKNITAILLIIQKETAGGLKVKKGSVNETSQFITLLRSVQPLLASHGLALTFQDTIQTGEKIVVSSTANICDENGNTVNASGFSILDPKKESVSFVNARKNALSALLLLDPSCPLIEMDEDKTEKPEEEHKVPSSVGNSGECPKNNPPKSEAEEEIKKQTLPPPVPTITPEEKEDTEQTSTTTGTTQKRHLTKEDQNWPRIVERAKQIGDAKKVYTDLSKVFDFEPATLAVLLSDAGLS